ncbi:mitochondrial ferric-chelate reductase [Andalucia godoyi]|uniref:Mitochondrial ferric-chelate reductase n=1 Tax=Andalucia godoyi TaxID=505711 RepID=A0A8K0AH57_ANDGO|nr:mitochondrial ferric-chelate reductase [Andalucia godoyi]|eukprot:ANDGO_00333.mRNA.1 mitochondrial ferric-chelate reductase
MHLIPRVLYPVLRRMHKPIHAIFPNVSFGDVMFLLAFIGVELALCAQSLRRGDGGRSTGGPIQWNMAFLLIPVTKRVSPLLVILNVPFERAIKFHRWISYATVILTVIHFFFLVFGNDMNQFSNVAGLIAMTAFLMLFLTSLAWIRRNLYEGFMKSHYVLAPIAYIFAILHEDAGGLILRCIVPVILYAADWVARIFVGVRRNATILSATVVSGKPGQRVVKWEILVQNAGNAYAEPGQYVYLYVPSLKWSQMHPFSIAYTRPLEQPNFDQEQSAHRKGGSSAIILGFFIREFGQYTQYMTKLEVNARGEGPKVAVDGPFGSSALDLARYTNFSLIAGGVGITPMLSFWNWIVASNTHKYDNAQSSSSSPASPVSPTSTAVTTTNFDMDVEKSETATASPVVVNLCWSLQGREVPFAISVLEQLALPGPRKSSNAASQVANDHALRWSLPAILRVRLQFTRTSEIAKEEMDKLQTLIAKKVGVDIEVHVGPGRLAIPEVLKNAARTAIADPAPSDPNKNGTETVRVAVLACGPFAMLSSVRSSSVALSGIGIPPFESVHFDVHTETFEL